MQSHLHLANLKSIDWSATINSSLETIYEVQDTEKQRCLT
jgi:hypothetical protein